MKARHDTRRLAIEAIRREQSDIEFRVTGGKAHRSVNGEAAREIDYLESLIDRIRGLG